STRVALLDVPAERRSAAGLDRGHHAPLRGREPGTSGCTIGIAVATEDVRHLQRRTIHERASADGRRGRSRGRRRTWEQVERTGGRTDLRRGDAQIAGGGFQAATAEQ